MIRDRDHGPVLTDRRSTYEVMRDVMLGAAVYPIESGKSPHPERRRLLRSNLPEDALGYQNYALAVVKVERGQSFLQLYALEPSLLRRKPQEILEALNEGLDETVGQGFSIVRYGIIQYEDEGEFPKAVEIEQPVELVNGTTDAMFEIFETQHRGRDFHPYHQ